MSRRSRQSSVDVTGLGGQALAAGATMERTNRANGRRSPLEERWEADRADQQIGLPAVEGPIVPRTAPERALAWRERGRATTMLRTASDGADVMVEEGGMEWDVLEPHGTGRRHNHDRDPWAKAQASMTRRRVADTFTCRGRLILTQAFRYCAAYALVQTDRSVSHERRSQSKRAHPAVVISRSTWSCAQRFGSFVCVKRSWQHAQRTSKYA